MCKLPNCWPNRRAATPKIFGMSNEKVSGKPKYLWIAKTNSDGTQYLFPISCPEQQ